MVALQFARKRFIWDFEMADVKKPILGPILAAHSLFMDLKRGCLTSNENQHLTLPCDLHVLSSKGEFSINRISRLLETEFCDVAGLEPFDHPPPASRVYHSVDISELLIG